MYIIQVLTRHLPFYVKRVYYSEKKKTKRMFLANQKRVEMKLATFGLRFVLVHTHDKGYIMHIYELLITFMM